MIRRLTRSVVMALGARPAPGARGEVSALDHLFHLSGAAALAGLRPLIPQMRLNKAARRPSGHKKTAGTAPRGGRSCQLRHIIDAAIEIRPVNERSTEERPIEDIGSRIAALSPIPCPALRIPCQPRKVSLPRPDQFAAPEAQ